MAFITSCTDDLEEDQLDSTELTTTEHSSDVKSKRAYKSSTDEFSIFAFNVQFLNTPFSNNGNPGLVEGSVIVNSALSNKYDVLVFTEAFETDDAAVLRSDLESIGYVHNWGPFGTGEIKNSGVMIMSKHPTLGAPYFEIFNACNGILGFDGADCDAAKGFLHVRLLDDNNHIYNIIGTHLDAGDDVSDGTARASQQSQIHDYIVANINVNEPLLIAGDLNVIGNSDHPLFTNNKFDGMLSRLDSEPSYDFANVSGGTTAGLDESPEKLLDYILVSKNGPRPISTEYNVLSNMSLGSYFLPPQQISDHRPIESIFTYDFSANSAAEITSCTSHQGGFGIEYWTCQHNGPNGLFEWKTSPIASYGTNTTSNPFICFYSIDLWEVSSNTIVDTYIVCP